MKASGKLDDVDPTRQGKFNSYRMYSVLILMENGYSFSEAHYMYRQSLSTGYVDRQGDFFNRPAPAVNTGADHKGG